MAGLHNTLRRLVADGTPVATGLHAIGDSVCTTNPTLGRGLALALSGAADLADAISEHAADPAAQALALDHLAGAHVVPFYHDQAGIDAARLAMMRHTIFGAPPPPAVPDSRPGHLFPAARGRVLGPDRLPRVLEDQRDDLPARRGLHRPGCRSAHAGNSSGGTAARRHSPSRPGSSSSPPSPGRGLHALSLTQPQPHGNGATFPATVYGDRTMVSDWRFMII